MAEDYSGHVGTPVTTLSVRDRNGAHHTRTSWEMFATDRGVPPYDDKGRPNVDLMGSDDKLTETLVRLRQLGDGIEQLSAMANENPMMRNLLGL